jgi:hypothetical protein
VKTLRHALLVVPAAVAALLLTVPVPARAGGSVQVRLLELNRSGARGTATLTPLGDGALRVSIRSSGLVPNAPHAQHLHGSTQGMDFHCPGPAADADHDGWVTTEEGTPVYGDIFVALTTRGDAGRASGLALDRMPVADARGDLRYDRTIPAADLPAGTVAHLEDLHIVQHGIDADGNHRYDVAALGESTLARSAGLDGVPEEATDPALCGMISGAAAGSVPVGGVATGDGSTRPDPAVRYATGGLALLTALGLLVAARRRPRTER